MTCVLYHCKILISTGKTRLTTYEAPSNSPTIGSVVALRRRTPSTTQPTFITSFPPSTRQTLESSRPTTVTQSGTPFTTQQRLQSETPAIATARNVVESRRPPTATASNSGTALRPTTDLPSNSGTTHRPPIDIPSNSGTAQRPPIDIPNKTGTAQRPTTATLAKFGYSKSPTTAKLDNVVESQRPEGDRTTSDSAGILCTNVIPQNILTSHFSAALPFWVYVLIALVAVVLLVLVALALSLKLCRKSKIITVT